MRFNTKAADRLHQLAKPASRPRVGRAPVVGGMATLSESSRDSLFDRAREAVPAYESGGTPIRRYCQVSVCGGQWAVESLYRRHRFPPEIIRHTVWL